MDIGHWEWLELEVPMTMTMARTALRCQIQDLTNTLSQIIRKQYDSMELEENERPESFAMNVEYHQRETISESQHKNLQQGIQTEGGLSEESQDSLRNNLQPVLNALERLDADLLLDLKPAEYGPQVNHSRCCQSIYDEILPPMSDDAVTNSSSCVRYLHIAEISDQYSIGIFVFAPFARIPLHDHPDMCVLSRVLYGDLKRHSLDLARREDMEGFHDDSRRTGRRKSWLGGWFGSSRESQSQKLPEGTKRAFKNHVDHLEAPGVTALYPYEGNLHEFIAGPHGAAVLDVLLPPYDNFQNRDCTFYEIHHLTSQSTKGSGREPCYVVPTGQPENFHCISGRFGDLGEEDFE